MQLEMLQDRITRSLTLENSRDQLEEPDELALLTSLPDVPLLRVLSYLPPTDLGASGQASTRLGDVTRAHRSLWRGKRVCFEDCGGLVDLLRLAPPWDTLELRTDLSRSPSAVSSGGATQSEHPVDHAGDHGRDGVKQLKQGTQTPSLAEIDFHSSRTLIVRVCSGRTALRLIKRLGPRAKHLKIYNNRTTGVNQLLGSLQKATSLETLCVTWDWTRETQPSPSPDALWPPSAALPKLHTVELDYPPGAAGVRVPAQPQAASANCLQSLLLAHRSQLRKVSLLSPRLLPLVELCPDDLLRLSVAAAPGMVHNLARLLVRFQGLKELRISHSDVEHEVAAVLRSWTGPLICLKLPRCTEATVRALGTGALTSLEHLQLDVSEVRAVSALPAALAGLPRLRSLVLRTAPPPDVLCGLATATLCLLTILRDPCPPNNLSSRRTALRDLVNRAPQDLHVVRPPLTCSPGPGAPAGAPAHAAAPAAVPVVGVPDRRVLIFGKHSAAESELCRLCTEARETSALTSTATLPYVCVGS